MFNKNSMNLKSIAMKPVFEGQTTVYLYADDEKEIVDGITFLKGYGIDKIVIVGATESENQLNFIKENTVFNLTLYNSNIRASSSNNLSFFDLNLMHFPNCVLNKISCSSLQILTPIILSS